MQQTLGDTCRCLESFLLGQNGGVCTSRAKESLAKKNPSNGLKSA